MKIFRLIALSFVVTGAVASTQIKASAEPTTKLTAMPLPVCTPNVGCGMANSL